MSLLGWAAVVGANRCVTEGRRGGGEGGAGERSGQINEMMDAGAKLKINQGGKQID